MTAPISGFGTNLTPDYSKETSQVQQAHEGIGKGSSKNKGVILTDDSLDVPFERQVDIASQGADSGRPSLTPLLQTGAAEERGGDNAAHAYYLALRDGLSPGLKNKLEQDEAQTSFKDRDPDLVALDGSLQFGAQLLALADSPPSVIKGSDETKGMPECVQKELSAMGSSAIHVLDAYLSTLSSNDPSAEIFQEVSNQLKEALHVLERDQNQPEQSA